MMLQPTVMPALSNGFLSRPPRGNPQTGMLGTEVWTFYRQNNTQ